MFVIEKPGQFISGIFASKESAVEYAAKVGKTQKLRELKMIKDYPFFILEKPRGTFEYMQYKKDLPKKWTKKKNTTVYTITKDWQPPTPGEDYMGALDHEHGAD